jgi:hypothetical protein
MSDKAYPDPTERDLADPLFERVWQAIKGWDISRTSDRLYAGATGNDVMHILGAVRSPSDHPTPETALLDEHARRITQEIVAITNHQPYADVDSLATERVIRQGLERFSALLAHPMGQQKEQDQGSCPASTQGVIAHVERQAADAPVTEE